MKEIMEHFGAGLLALITGVAATAIYLSCIRNGGILSGIVAGYMSSLCG